MRLERALALALLGAAAQAYAHPVGDWAGEYRYVESGGRTAGGSRIAVEHRLVLAATDRGPRCTLASHGFQTDDEIECTFDLADRIAAIRFGRFVRGGPAPGVERYGPGDTLFTLERTRRSSSPLVTHWQRFRPDRARAARGAYFALRRDPELRAVGVFGRFRYVAAEDDCLGRIVWLRRRGAAVDGEVAAYEGPCETIKARIVRGSYDPRSGALAFVTEPATEIAGEGVGWRFDGRLRDDTLHGKLFLVVPATGEVRDAAPDAPVSLPGLRRLPRPLR
jgi:hypothetical protein